MTDSLMSRIAEGRTDLVFECLGLGHPATLSDAHGTSLLEWCAYHGDVSAIRYLLGHGADPNRATIPGIETEAFMRDIRTRGETPLHRAAAFGTETAVRLLLDAGASREAKDVNGDTPLSWASWHLRPAAILRMLCYGSFRIHPANHSTYDHGMGW